MGLAVAAVISTAVAVGGTVIASQQQRKARRRAEAQQRRAEQVRQNQAMIQARRQKVQQLREARVREATVRQRAVTAGVTGASSALAAAGSIQSQLGANLNFIDQTQASATQAAGFTAAARSELLAGQSRAALTAGVTGLAGNIFRAAGSFNLFGGSQATTPDTGGFGTEEFNRMVRNREV